MSRLAVALTIGERFTAANNGAIADFDFAVSSDLANQLTQGAAADVFASGNVTNMNKVAEAGLLAGNAVNFASNTLVIAVAPANPRNIRSFADVLNKVTTGQADAGLVSLTDARSADDKVTTVAFPEAASAVNVYPIAVLKGSAKPDLARKFVDLVTGDVGQQLLHQAGFVKP